MLLARDDCLDANSCTQSLSHLPWEFPALLTCHACRSPLGRDPHESSLSQWLFNGGAYYCAPTPHAWVPRDLGLSLLATGVWLWKPPFFVHLYCWGAEARGLHALPWCYPLFSSLTRKPNESPSCPAVLSSGPLLRGPTALTLVNAQVWEPVGNIIYIYIYLKYFLKKIKNTSHHKVYYI